MEVVIVLTLALFNIFEIGGTNGMKNSSIFNDRINLDLGLARATAINKEDGSVSTSHGQAFGYNAGILYPGSGSDKGHYDPIASQVSSTSNSYASGKKPPSTFAETEVDTREQDGIKGSAAAGFSGGEGIEGSSSSSSHSEQIAIPIFGGAVILSNLHPVNGTRNNTLTPNLPKSEPNKNVTKPTKLSSGLFFTK